MCQNIEDFNRGCTLILARLYAHFPRPVILDLAALDDGADLLPEERAARMAERRVIYAATVTFLADEDYIVTGNHAGPEEARKFSGVRLTSKGLAALSRSPRELDASRKSIGDLLLDAVPGLLADGVKGGAKMAVSALFGG